MQGNMILFTCFADHIHHFRILVIGGADRSRFDDTGFITRNLCDGRSKKLCVFKTDIGHDSQFRRIDRIS